MQDETTVGFLKEAMSCVVTEERNGVFELKMKPFISKKTPLIFEEMKSAA
jgi:hypothetical protein